MNLIRPLWTACSILLLLSLSGCVLAPKGTSEEEKRIASAGKPYEAKWEERKLPDLPSPATWQDVLHRAFLANGELEAGYFEWKASLARVRGIATWPNSNVAVSGEYMFSKESMKAFDRTTVNITFDTAQMLGLPSKVEQEAKVALAEARATGERFVAMKFDMQKRVLDAYYDLALMRYQIQIEQENLSLLKLIRDTAENRLQAGGPQADLTKAQIEYRLAENEVETMQQQAHAMEAMLNGMLMREATSPLALPPGLPPKRPLKAEDWQLIAVATDRNPELAALAHDTQGRKDALKLAQLMWLPDINPMAGFTGNTSQSLGAMVVLPTNIPKIKADIEQMRAMLRAAEATARQTKAERAARFVAALYALRNAERQTRLFQDMIIPQARQDVDIARQAYSAGSIGFVDLLDSQRTLLDAQRLTANAQVEREKRLVEMEQLAGVDIETIEEGSGEGSGFRVRGSVNADSEPSSLNASPASQPLNPEPRTLNPSSNPSTNPDHQ